MKVRRWCKTYRIACRATEMVHRMSSSLQCVDEGGFNAVAAKPALLQFANASAYTDG